MAEGVTGFDGVFRARIVAVDDPEARRRYRVRVIGVHPGDLQVESLPWAEFCLFGGKFFGDFPVFELDDRVWVMFEHGDRRFPVIFGGWLSSSSGIPDLPQELAGDRQSRWVRVDRVGNIIEMSPLTDEMHIRFASGGAELTLSQTDDSIKLKADRRVSVEAPAVEVTAETLTGEAARALLHVRERAVVRSDDSVSITAARTIHIGKYEDELLGVALPHTTPEVSIDADDLVQLETRNRILGHAEDRIDFIADNEILLQAPTKILIEGTTRVRIETQKCEIEADILVDIKAPLVNVDGATQVAVHGGKVDLSVDGSCTGVIGGDLDLSASSIRLAASGAFDISAGGALSLSGATMSASADAGMTLLGGTRVTLDAVTILVG